MNKIYDVWKNHKRVSEQLKKDMLLMNEEEVSVAFNEAQLGFGTAGYRAKMGPGNHYLNEITYQQITEGYAKFIINKFGLPASVLVVHDNRRNAKLFTDVVAKTFTSFGIKVYLTENNELLPTPVTSYLIPKLHCQGCVNITASHNPKDYNGYKCYDETGCQMLPDDSMKLIELMPTWSEILDKEIKADLSLIEEFDSKLIDQYFEDVKKALGVENKKPLHSVDVVYTSMHGTASKYMPKFIESLGHKCHIVEEQCYPDENFKNAPNCNPEDYRSLALAVELADKKNIDVILATDPDADRLGISIKKDGKWIYLTGNQAGTIETYYRIQKLASSSEKTPVIVSTYISTNLIDRIAKKYYGKVIRTATGFKWVGDQINKLQPNEIYVNGFEEAIGALPTDLNRDKDSFQAATLILDIISEYKARGMDLIDILEKEIYPEYGHWFGETISLIIPGVNWKDKANQMMDLLKNFKDMKMLGREIVRTNYNHAGSCLEFFFDDWSWVKFRLSGTEPKFKIYTNLYSTESEGEYNPEVSVKLQNEAKEMVRIISEYLGI